MQTGSTILVLLIIVAGLGAVRAESPKDESPKDLWQRRDRLEAIFAEQIRALPLSHSYREQLDAVHRTPDRNLLYLRSAPLPVANNTQLMKRRKQYASSLVRLGERSLSEDAALAYQLFHQAAAFDTGRPGLPVLGRVADREDIVAAVAKTDHPRIGWKRGRYWRVHTEHFQISTNKSAEAGEQLAQRLENLYRTWRQLFFPYWSDANSLRSAWKHSRPLRPRSLKHRVVLFEDRQQYVQHLHARQPRIEISLGFYDVDSNTSFFFSGPSASTSTHLHEVTHQLFQEAKTATRRQRWPYNFWVIEGIAMYVESLQARSFTATVGGLDANRLQFARYRCLQEKFYVPLSELVQLGQRELQRDERIRRIYSQSAGLVHFLMDGQKQKYRMPLMHYLRLIYEGRDRPDSLATVMATPLPQLDLEYQAFLQVTDQDLLDARITTDSVTSLCLGNTNVTDRSLATIPAQGNLVWLDVANTKTTTRGLAFMLASRQLRQLNLAGTGVADELLKQLVPLQTMQELDLSHTQITDNGLRWLRGLPNLEILWLDATQVSDASLGVLTSFPRLEELGISETRISEQGRQQLRRAKTTLKIN